MKYLTLIYIYICISFTLVHQILSLKCRTGNQQSDDQFQKIMQVCRRRFLGFDEESARDYNGRETDSQESSDSNEDEDMFDSKFLSSGGYRYNKNDKMSSGNRYENSGSSSSRNQTRQFSGRNWKSNNTNGGRSSSDNWQMSSNRRNMRNNGMDSRGDNNYSNKYNSNNNNNNNMNRNNNNNGNNKNYNNGNDYGNNNGERDQVCIVQCFFNELNLVDQKGFPERTSVISVMTQNIQDPELRDFIEESVIECYRYLNNNGRQDKCQFSQNLLSCLGEKGSERCEDWDDD